MRYLIGRFRRILESLVIITKQLHIIQQKLDLLLSTSGNVSAEQLSKLRADSQDLGFATTTLLRSIEQQTIKTKGK